MPSRIFQPLAQLAALHALACIHQVEDLWAHLRPCPSLCVLHRDWGTQLP